MGTPTTPTQPAPKLGQGAAGEFAKGALKAVATPLLEIGGGIQKALTGGQAKNTGVETAGAIRQQPSTGTSEDIGNIVGTVAPYFTGAGEEELAARLGTFIPKLAESLGMKVEGLIPRIANYLVTKSPEITKNTAIGTAQTGSPVQGAITGVGG
jgi:hypothetical protein